MLDDSSSMDLAQAVEREGTTQIMNLRAEDGKEAILTLLQERDAVFNGR